MVKAEFEEEEVEEMRGALVHEGWVANPALPKHWMMREPPSGGRDHNGLKFVNEAGTKFESTRAAIDHLKSENPTNLSWNLQIPVFGTAQAPQPKFGICTKHLGIGKG